MYVLASSPALVPAIVGAIGAVIAAVLAFIAAVRAQTRKELLESINELLRKYADAGFEDFKEELRALLDARTRGLFIAEIVKRALREVLRTHDAEERERRRHWWQR